MDFRLGTWELTNEEGFVFGVQSFEKILDGCAIQEIYETRDLRRKGSSLTYYDRRAGVWRQTYADNQGNWTEGLGRVVDGLATFEGHASRFPHIRWSIRRESSSQLRGVTEVSDDGKTWKILGEQIMRRVSLPADGSSGE